MEQQLYTLLHQCTVRLSVPGKIGHGTGFFVAPGLILTCAHVLKDALSDSTFVEVYWNGQSYPAKITKIHREHDLALLQVKLTDHPCVYLSEEAVPFDNLYSYGYPVDHPNDPVTFTLEGKAGAQGDQLKFKTGQVQPGLSGAALLNVRTGYVCGVVRFTRDRNSDLGGRAIPTSTIFRLFPRLVTQQQQFHQQDRRWTHCQKNKVTHIKRFVDCPRNYIPFPRNSLFQQRPGEFEQLEHLLFGTETKQHPPRIGLVGIGMVGMGGIGKTQLAVEFAYRYQHRFLGGIFWMSAVGTNVFAWHHPMAELAFNTGYLPPNDDISSPENDLRRSEYFCRYLAKHNDALLILDNVEDPNLVISALPPLAGGEVTCAILYTSRNKIVPNGARTYQVEQLSEEGALRLLLDGTRSSLLSEVLLGSRDAEVLAAREVCQGVEYLPLALVHLRGLLVRGQNVKLVRLAEVLKQRGALNIAKTLHDDASPLFATFWLSWEKVRDEEIRRLFKLASYFPEAVSIPLWLLGLASGLGENADFFEPLGEARVQLQELSLMEELSGEHVRLHPLVREFGRRLVAEEGSRGKALLEEAGERLVREFTDLNKLERRALDAGYWVCLEQMRSALAYLELLKSSQTELLKRVERWLDRESYLLGDRRLWPEVIPDLFFQQIYNRSVEDGIALPESGTHARWIRQVSQVGADSHSLLRVFSGNTSWVESVAFSPDGGKVLTGSRDKTARLWETMSGKLLATFKGHTDGVESVAFSPDGGKVLTGSRDKTARLWETTSGRLLTVFEGHVNWVTTVAFSPDGSKVLTGSEDDLARLWETTSGRLLTVFEGHTNWVTSVAFSPDGSKVLTGSADQTARLWQATSGKPLTTILDSRSDWITSVAFSPDGSKVLTGSTNKTAKLWGTESGKLLTTFKGHTSAVESVAFSPDGNKVLTGSTDKTAKLWEVTSGDTLTTLEGHTSVVKSVAFSPDGSKMLTGSFDGSVYLWEMANSKLLTILNGHAGGVEDAVFSPDGSKVLIWSGSTVDPARLWDTTDGRLLAELEGPSSAVTCVVFSADGNRALAASEDSTARLWDMKNGKLLTTFEGHTDVVWSVAFSPDNSKVLTGSADGTARLWNTKNGKLLAVLKDQTGAVMKVKFSPDGHLMMTCNHHGRVFFWRAERPEIGRILGVYIASHEVEAIYWKNTSYVVLSDTGGIHSRPHLYRLKLEGIW